MTVNTRKCAGCNIDYPVGTLSSFHGYGPFHVTTKPLCTLCSNYVMQVEHGMQPITEECIFKGPTNQANFKIHKEFAGDRWNPPTHIPAAKTLGDVEEADHIDNTMAVTSFQTRRQTGSQRRKMRRTAKGG